MSELKNQNINEKRKNKIVSKIGQQLLEYRIFFKDMLTLLGLDYRDYRDITLYLVVPGIIIQKIRKIV